MCFDCEMTLFWQNLLKGVCFSQNGFFLEIAGKNSRFSQNSLTYRDSVMVIFRFLGQNGLKLELRTFAVHRILIEIKGRYQVNLQEKMNHNRHFSQLSETEAINLKKVASFFQDAIHFHPGHLQPNTLIFTIRALVE